MQKLAISLVAGLLVAQGAWLSCLANGTLGAYLEEQAAAGATESGSVAPEPTPTAAESNSATPGPKSEATVAQPKSSTEANPTVEPKQPKKQKQKVQIPFPIGSKVSRTLQQVTGINLLTGFVVSHIGQSVLHHKLGGKVKVKIQTYSLTDLLAGKVKSVQVSLKDAKLKGVSLGRILISSSNPLWIALPGKGRKAGVKSPVFVAVKAQLSQKDVTQALKSEEVTNQLRGLKLDLPGLGDQQLQVIKPKVEIIDDAVRIEALLITKGGKEETAVPIIISAKPKLLDDARIVLEDMKVTSPDIENPEEFAMFMQDLFNPLVNFARMDTYEHAFRLASFGVGGKEVNGEGKLLLVPRDLAKQLAQKGLTK